MDEDCVDLIWTGILAIFVVLGTGCHKCQYFVRGLLRGRLRLVSW
jgi:hypothetical protein